MGTAGSTVEGMQRLGVAAGPRNQHCPRAERHGWVSNYGTAGPAGLAGACFSEGHLAQDSISELSLHLTMLSSAVVMPQPYFP